MLERDEAIHQIKAKAQELVNEDGLDFDIFRLAHTPTKRCRTQIETTLKTRIVELGLSEGYIAKRLRCERHNTSSEWVHEDY
jgi:hypothetical protein